MSHPQKGGSPHKKLPMDIWKFIADKLSVAQSVMLLYVLDSEGSSPGRSGFKMAVANDGSICGTIGGGIMEHKLVEKAKAMLHTNEMKVELMRQYHDKQHTTDQSGMICLGNQLNVFIPVTNADEKTIETILQDGQFTIQLSPKGLSIYESTPADKNHSLQFKSNEDWFYREKINQRPVIHIIGGGHVSLALSELMCFLGFYSKVYDDRPELNTILNNFFANEKIIVSGYEQLNEYITDCKNDYAVIMTMGYRTDKIALQQLLQKEFYYLGMMGSEHKIEMLMNELKADGVSEESLKKVFTPIGVNIYSKTTPEIAVSIAAEIIREKNKELPTGRNY
jgi:xanthine dehydrogenase accessory factor